MKNKSIDVIYLKSNKQYYDCINLMLSGRSVTSVQSSFKTTDTPHILSIEGLVNVRDVGGWKTADGKTIKQGILYCGSELVKKIMQIDGVVSASLLSHDGEVTF